ncbi:MAG: MBL fold metallo-hydrolase, partial [Polyangiales bacterium]
RVNSGTSAPSLEVEVRPSGLYLPALALYLDPDRPVARAFVSHAHGDHAAGSESGTVFASPETLALIAARRGAVPGEQPVGWDESVEMDGMRVSIAPAGHVLGAAQLVIDHPGGRFVYTGDYRTGGGATHATGAPVPCDTLCIETTFALPVFQWPDREKTIAELIAWCRETLESGETPVLLAYALGKSQALIHALLDAGLPVIAHGAVHRVCAAYESLGVDMGIRDGRLAAYVEEKKRGRLNGVVIMPPTAIGLPIIKQRKGIKVAYVSGFALIDASIEQHRADRGFAISDHADFDDLMATVRASGARFVYATHGEAVPFARWLQSQGIAASALEAHAIDAREETAA